MVYADFSKGTNLQLFKVTFAHPLTSQPKEQIRPE